MVNKKLAKKILSRYYDLRFPSSFGGVAPFRKALKDVGINISHEALRRLLKSSVHYQTNFIKNVKLKRRKLYSAGFGIECYCDTIFINLGGKQRFVFLCLIDNHTRYMYATALNGLSKEDLKNGFSRILKVSPKWSIIRVDRDPTINSLKTSYFARKHILLQVRRSVKHMTYFENIIRNLKRRFIQNMQVNGNGQPWTYRRLVKALEAVVYSYNHTPSSSHKFKPADVNDSQFDPLLRKNLYGPQAKLRRFEDIYVEQLQLRKKMNTPDESKKRKNP